MEELKRLRKEDIKKLKELLSAMEDDNFDALENKKSMLKIANKRMQDIIRATQYIEEEKANENK